MKVILLAALVAFASAFEFDAKLDDMWTMWKGKFGRVYESENEVMRRAIWEKTVAFVNTHNLEADLGLHTYTVGLNQLSDLTNEEYKQLLGYRQGVHTGPVTEYMAPLNMGPMADDVDWRTKGYVNTIKNQGSCGSCWAFSATAAIEGQTFKKTGVLQNYAEQQLVDCSRYTGNMGCNGGWMDWAFQYVKDITAKSQFQDITSCYPYKAVDQSCAANFAATCKGATVTGFTDIKKNNETDLASAILTVGPISVAIDASRPGFSSYRSGVYNDPSCSSTNLDHGVTAVGYGNSGSDYYIVRNSWGTTWGNQGYILMSRNKNNQCGIAAAASYPAV